ncbi:MAG: LytR C-terminal domain-containing protein, partial [Bowdeniella nasicola]|nr:LytR C-terminal domain-containing protein [Bowdeniella nasicola]
VAPDASPTAEGTAEASPSPSPSEAASEPDRGQSVAVLNASGVKGLAGRVAQQLQDAGYTHVTSGNYKGGRPPRANTVYYNSPAFEAAAREIAEKIGIDQVIESSKATRGITVVLRNGVR